MVTSMRKSIRFYDDVHFPKGFNRKRFTIREAAVLEHYGLTMKGLLDGSLMAESDAEQLFLRGVKNEDKSVSLFVQCWLKYSELISKKSKLHLLCGIPYE